MKPLYLPAVVGRMIADTFRQAWASRVLQAMLIVNAAAIIFCLGVSVEGPARLDRERGFIPALDPENRAPRGTRPAGEVVPLPTHEEEIAAARRKGQGVIEGRLTLAFGLLSVPLARDAEDVIRLVQVVLAGFVAGTAGLLLTLVWTAGFLPAFLHPSAVTVVLTRPAPRWALLLGKFVGVILFVAVMAGVFVGGTWLALAIKTGVVDGRYLLVAPMLVFEFALFYSLSAMLAVSARSTVACAFGAILFWATCFGINYGRNVLWEAHAAETAAGKPSSLPASARWTAEAGYWLLPKPHDLLLIQYRMLDARPHQDTRSAEETVAAVPVLPSMLTSMLFPLFLLASAWAEFRDREF